MRKTAASSRVSVPTRSASGRGTKVGPRRTCASSAGRSLQCVTRAVAQQREPGQAGGAPSAVAGMSFGAVTGRRLLTGSQQIDQRYRVAPEMGPLRSTDALSASTPSKSVTNPSQHAEIPAPECRDRRWSSRSGPGGRRGGRWRRRRATSDPPSRARRGVDSLDDEVGDGGAVRPARRPRGRRRSRPKAEGRSKRLESSARTSSRPGPAASADALCNPREFPRQVVDHRLAVFSSRAWNPSRAGWLRAVTILPRASRTWTVRDRLPRLRGPSTARASSSPGHRLHGVS